MIDLRVIKFHLKRFLHQHLQSFRVSATAKLLKIKIPFVVISATSGITENVLAFWWDKFSFLKKIRTFNGFAKNVWKMSLIRNWDRIVKEVTQRKCKMFYMRSSMKLEHLRKWSKDRFLKNLISKQENILILKNQRPFHEI